MESIDEVWDEKMKKTKHLFRQVYTVKAGDQIGSCQ
jgi:hypothetical protein